jgi:hypothetical protein
MLAGQGPASAQATDVASELAKLEGTLYVQVQPQMVEGEIAGCQYVFDAIMRDFSYRQGGYAKISGSVAIMGVGGKIGTTMKVVLNDIDPENLATTPSAPGRVYLIGSDYKTNIASLVNSVPSDVPGGRFSIYQPSPTMEMILEGMKDKRLIVAFNREGGQTDLQLPIELDVVSTGQGGERVRSEENGLRFAQCVSLLMERVD